MRYGLVIALALAVTSVASDARAHDRSVSYSSWERVGDRFDVRLELSARDATALPRDGVGPRVAGAFALRRGGVVCGLVPGSVVALSAPDVRSFEWQVACPTGSASTRYELAVELLFEQLSGHIHLASIDGVEHVFATTSRSARWSRDSPAGPVARLVRYARLGAGHVLGGLDHLVFLLALVVVARGLREVAVVATGFTVGHSLTLALAVTGRVVPASGAIEALIGLSIVVVAVDNVWMYGSGSRRARAAAVVVGAVALIPIAGGAIPPATLVGCALFAACYFGLGARSEHPARLRLAVAALFGLVHGFGFASAMADLSVGSSLALPLFGFNLGVELGQLIVVACAYPLLALAARHGRRPLVVDVASSAALAAGMFWFVSRNF